MAVLTFVLSLFLLTQYNAADSSKQLGESYLWIASLGVHSGLAVDGIAVALILLTSFVGILVIVGIVLMIVWSFWLGLIIALVGLIAFGGFARGKWY